MLGGTFLKKVAIMFYPSRLGYGLRRVICQRVNVQSNFTFSTTHSFENDFQRWKKKTADLKKNKDLIILHEFENFIKFSEDIFLNHWALNLQQNRDSKNKGKRVAKQTDRDLEQLKIEFCELASERDTFRVQYGGVQAKLKITREEIENLKTENKDLQRIVSGYKEFERSNRKLTSENQELKTQNNGLKSSNKDFKSKIENLEKKNIAQIQSLEIERHSQLNYWKSKNKQLSLENQNICKNVKAQNAKLKIENQNLRPRNNTLELENKNLNSRNNKLELENQNLNSKNQRIFSFSFFISMIFILVLSKQKFIKKNPEEKK